MNVPGIQNALAALTALNSASGSKAPSPATNTMRPGPTASFKQALSQEVAQRQNAFNPPARPQPGAKPQPGARPPQAVAQHAPQQAARAQPGDKLKGADKADKADAGSPVAAATPADGAAPAAPVAQASETKPEEKTAVDSAISLADIPGGPQAALMMQLMNTIPAAFAVPADAAPGAAALDGRNTGKDAAAQGLVDLQAVAGKEEPVAGEPAAGDAAASAPAELHAAFGKAMSEAGQQAAQALTQAQAEAPVAPAALTALQAAVQAAQALTQAPAGPVEKLTPPVGTPAWDQALGQKIVWMAQGGEQTATLTMNPPDLGPMQVVLSVSNNQATVDFMSAQPEVRQALENALPRLREMMGETGVTLGQANVSAGSQQQFAGSGEQNSGRRGKGNDGMAVDDSAPPLRQGVVRMARDGAVDTFA
jgi:flagellar hook-length control protein FliK